MKRLFTLLLITTTWHLSVLACSCLPPPPPIESLEDAHAVFVGVPLTDQAFDERHRIFEFEVIESFKGDSKKKVKVVTGLGDGDCGVAFVVGRRYLVYADRSGKHLSAHLCTRTTMIFDPSHEAELEILRKHRK